MKYTSESIIQYNQLNMCLMLVNILFCFFFRPSGCVWTVWFDMFLVKRTLANWLYIHECLLYLSTYLWHWIVYERTNEQIFLARRFDRFRRSCRGRARRHGICYYYFFIVDTNHTVWSARCGADVLRYIWVWVCCLLCEKHQTFSDG